MTSLVACTEQMEQISIAIYILHREQFKNCRERKMCGSSMFVCRNVHAYFVTLLFASIPIDICCCYFMYKCVCDFLFLQWFCLLFFLLNKIIYAYSLMLIHSFGLLTSLQKLLNGNVMILSSNYVQDACSVLQTNVKVLGLTSLPKLHLI